MSVQLVLSKRLKKNLLNLETGFYDEMKKQFVETALVDIETPAKKRVRVDTGRLRASINTKYGRYKWSYTYKDKNGKKFIGTLDYKPKNNIKEFEVIVGTNVAYANKIEERYPYLHPAFIKARQKLVQRLKRLVKKWGV